MTPRKFPKSILGAAAPAALTLLAPALFLSAPLHADDGTWTNLSGGAWSTPGNWSGDTIADGSGSLADFSTLNITADRTVTLDGDRTIGSLKFGDTTGSSKWTIGGSSILTLATGAGSPTITTTTNGTISATLKGTQGFVKDGTGTLSIGNQVGSGDSTNTISGNIQVNAGQLTFGHANAVKNTTASITIADGASLNFFGAFAAGTMTNNLTLGGNGFNGGGAFQIGGNGTYNGTITLSSDSKIHHLNNTATVKGTITGAGKNLELSTGVNGQPDLIIDAAIQTDTGSVSVRGTGSSQIQLRGTNTYTGATTVFTGTLMVNGSITSAVTVTDGSMFGGTGTSSESIDVENGGTITGGEFGAGANAIGTFTTTGEVSFDEGSTYSLEFNSTLATFDQIAASGFSIDNANLNLTDLGSATLSLGQVYTILDGTSSSISGAFFGLAEGSVVTIGDNSFKISYLADSGRDVTLTTVSTIPEPSTWAMVCGIASIAFAACRRRAGRFAAHT